MSLSSKECDWACDLYSETSTLFVDGVEEAVFVTASEVFHLWQSSFSKPEVYMSTDNLDAALLQSLTGLLHFRLSEGSIRNRAYNILQGVFNMEAGIETHLGGGGGGGGGAAVSEAEPESQS